MDRRRVGSTSTAAFAAATVLAFCLSFAGAAPAPAAAPAGRMLEAWLRAFDAGDRNGYRAFLATHFPAGLRRLDDDLQFRRMTGGFDVVRVERTTATEATVLAQDRLNEIFARISMQVDAVKPDRIVGIGVTPVPRPPGFALPHLNEGRLIAAIRARLQREAAADRFAGVVVIAKDGRLLFARASGFSDRERRVKNALSTRFRIGSMSKMFTAVATMQLVEEGKIRLDAPFGKYVPDYPNKAVGSKVTIRELLTHTGGTGDFFGPQYDANRLRLRTLQDYVDLFGSRGVSFEPGSRWEYSNYGFIILGVVIERASGRSYYDFVRDHIYVPAHMTSSGAEPEGVSVPGRSIGYMQSRDGSWQPNTDTLPYRGTSAGGSYSTAADLLRFAGALTGHVLLDAYHTKLLTSGTVDTPRGRYALGFEDDVRNGTRCFGHGGGAPGMNGDLRICPGPGYDIVVLANIDPPAAQRLSDFITDRLP